MNIACIIVTYNRKELLLECLGALLKQSTPIQKVYLIDNNSSDGTYNSLKNSPFLENKIIEYHNTQRNTGGAGGFSLGVELALKNNHDWYWLMDDDVEPEKNALENLLKYKDISKCIHPKKYFLDGSDFKWDGRFNPKKLTTKWNLPERFDANTTFLEINYGCFEGMLIHHDIVKKIGLPDKRFFIHTDDLTYGYLASLYTKVLYVNDAIFIKKIKKSDVTIFLGKKINYLNGFNQYFNMRNHFLLRETLLIRNKTSRFISIFFIWLKFMKILFISLFIHQNMKDAKMILWGFSDGLKGDYNGHKRFID